MSILAESETVIEKNSSAMSKRGRLELDIVNNTSQQVVGTIATESFSGFVVVLYVAEVCTAVFSAACNCDYFVCDYFIIHLHSKVCALF